MSSPAPWSSGTGPAHTAAADPLPLPTPSRAGVRTAAGAKVRPDRDAVGTQSDPAPTDESGPRLINPADVVIRDVEWLIRHRLRRNTLNLLQGHGGVNKGTYTCHVAALATKGELSGLGPVPMWCCSRAPRTSARPSCNPD